jgi:hypothetical protein
MSESLALIRSGVSKLLGVIEHAELDYSIMKDESTFRFRSEAESLLVNLYQHSMEFFLASLQFLARRRSKQFAGKWDPECPHHPKLPQKLIILRSRHRIPSAKESLQSQSRRLAS